jgi:hypothetical protein
MRIRLLLPLAALATLAGSSGTSWASDRDRDGLPDRWEKRYSLSTSHRSGSSDPDRDGLSNRGEYRHRTNPRVSDTDGDGASDGAEVRAHSNPRSKHSVPKRCSRRATPGDLDRVLAASAPGETICLAAGDYGTFRGAAKRGTVTLSADPLLARASMEIDFDGAQNLALDGLTIRGARLTGATRSIVIRNSAFTAPTTIDGLANANVVFDHDTFNDMDVPDAHSTPARIHLSYAGQTPSGVTIENSLLAGGDADGIQSGVGVKIVGNEFRDILGHGGPNHTDAIQLLDAPHSVVSRNYIHHTDTGIVAYDGLEGATIEDNAIDLTQPGSQRPWAIELYSDSGSTVRHNTLKYGGCDYDLPCGLIELNRKDGDDAGQGTVVTDNVATDISVQNGSTVARRGGNLLRRGGGAGDVRGAPVYAGGADPSDYAGFRLAGDSPGKRAASGGSDPGISG